MPASHAAKPGSLRNGKYSHYPLATKPSPSNLNRHIGTYNEQPTPDDPPR